MMIIDKSVLVIMCDDSPERQNTFFTVLVFTHLLNILSARHPYIFHDYDANLCSIMNNNDRMCSQFTAEP